MNLELGTGKLTNKGTENTDNAGGAKSDPRLIVISASLKNHDGPSGNIFDRGIWAKIYNIQSKTWLTTSSFMVNETSRGGERKNLLPWLSRV